MAAALRLLERGRVDTASLITHHLGLAEVEEGLKLLDSGDETVGKIIIRSAE